MRLTVIAIGLALIACGDLHEERVRVVMEGGEGREEWLRRWPKSAKRICSICCSTSWSARGRRRYSWRY